MKRHLTLASLACCVLWGLTGCHRKPAVAPPRPAPVPVKHTNLRMPAPPLTPAQLAQSKPDESGVIMILEYHSVAPEEKTYQRSLANFQNDLDRLYKDGYYPVPIADYLDNKINAPAGKSPVIFTFDDARASQFKYLPDGSIDPNCAVGLLLNFSKTHPDFPARAIFYVLPKEGFKQRGQEAKKIQFLLDNGFEIGNHTVNHIALRKLSDTAVEKEIAGCVQLTQQILPGIHMDSIALPYGSWPKNRKLLASGEYEGQHYTNRAVLEVGAEPAPSPISKKFKPMALPRVQACEGFEGITYWLNYLHSHPDNRYISDGDPNAVTLPKYKAPLIDKAKLQGATLRLY